MSRTKRSAFAAAIVADRPRSLSPWPAASRKKPRLPPPSPAAPRHLAQASAPASLTAPAEATSACDRLAQEAWSVELSGLRQDSLNSAYYKKIKAAGKDYLQKTVDKKGVATTYAGVSLSAVIAMIDGADSAAPFAFDEALWKKGYDVTLTAKPTAIRPPSPRRTSPRTP